MQFANEQQRQRQCVNNESHSPKGDPAGTYWQLPTQGQYQRPLAGLINIYVCVFACVCIMFSVFFYFWGVFKANIQMRLTT